MEVIPAYVFAVGHNERYIFGKQHPLKGEFSDEVIDVEQTNFYLIDLKRKPGPNGLGLYAPLDVNEYNVLCSKLKVGEMTYDLVYPERP